VRDVRARKLGPSLVGLPGESPAQLLQVGDVGLIEMRNVWDCLPGFAYARRRLAADAAHRLALYLPPFGEIGERRGHADGGGPQASHVEDDRAGVIPDILFGYATARLRADHFVDVDSQFARQPAHRRRGGEEVAPLLTLVRFLRLQ